MHRTGPLVLPSWQAKVKTGWAARGFGNARGTIADGDGIAHDHKDDRDGPEGQLTYNTTAQMLNAAIAGLGLAYVPEGMAQPDLAKRHLKRVLEDWCPPYSGYHLWYPSRRQSSAAFALLVDALRYRRG